MPRRQLNILLVEDNDDHAELIRMSLVKNGVCGRLERAADGDAALRLLSQQQSLPAAERSELILLDINLPGRSGLDILAEIKSHPQLRHAPVIVLTTSDAARDRALAYQRHANSYLVKPVEYDQFLALMDDFADYWAQWNQTPHPSQSPS